MTETQAVRVSRHDTFSQPQLHVALQGVEQGVPVVLSHALGLDMSLWDDLAQSLAASHPVLRTTIAVMAARRAPRALTRWSSWSTTRRA